MKVNCQGCNRNVLARCNRCGGTNYTPVGPNLQCQSCDGSMVCPMCGSKRFRV